MVCWLVCFGLFVFQGRSRSAVVLASRYRHWGAWGKGKGAAVMYGSPYGGYAYPSEPVWYPVDPADSQLYDGGWLAVGFCVSLRTPVAGKRRGVFFQGPVWFNGFPLSGAQPMGGNLQILPNQSRRVLRRNAFLRNVLVTKWTMKRALIPRHG